MKVEAYKAVNMLIKKVRMVKSLLAGNSLLQEVVDYPGNVTNAALHEFPTGSAWTEQ